MYHKKGTQNRREDKSTLEPLAALLTEGQDVDKETSKNDICSYSRKDTVKK